MPYLHILNNNLPSFLNKYINVIKVVFVLGASGSGKGIQC